MTASTSGEVPTAVILAAGMGSRLTRAAGVMNKSLVPLEDRAVLSRIIDRLPKGWPIVVAVGHLADQVETYLRLAHADRGVRTVRVEPYQGPGSGPGTSLLCCRPYVPGAFVVVCADTLWDGPIDWDIGEDWIGVAPVPESESGRFCNCRLDGGRVVELRDKQAVSGSEFAAFVGLFGVRDAATFWRGLESSDTVRNERQLSNGLRALVARGGVRGVTVTWEDVGDDASYQAAVARRGQYDFGKPGEAVYIVPGDGGEPGRVIKFFADAAVADRRVRRAAQLGGLAPEILAHEGSFYVYRFAPGRTLSEAVTPGLLSELLATLESRLWRRVDAPGTSSAAEAFYHAKTLQRVRMLPEGAGAGAVNGIATPALRDLLTALPWASLREPEPVTFHGDLQFDNIVHDPASGRFTLLDWRDEFGGQWAFGDLYYDLAKLLGGIHVNYRAIKRGLFSVSPTPDGVELDWSRSAHAEAMDRVLMKWAGARGLDTAKIRVLTGLVYLNMAPLHQPPFGDLLLALSRQWLARELGAASAVAGGRAAEAA